jgi:hypothetical protein
MRENAEKNTKRVTNLRSNKSLFLSYKSILTQNLAGFRSFFSNSSVFWVITRRKVA